MSFELVALPSGGVSLRSVEHGETFHPGIGPRTEAEVLHVNQHRFATRAAHLRRFVLWDVGLGAAANAVAALEALESLPVNAEIHSFDHSTAPLEFAVQNHDSLSYLSPHREKIAALLSHGEVRVTPKLHWFFHKGDFRERMITTSLPAPHSIFYDPYSPAKNHEMWTLEHFRSLRALLNEECLLTNYTRSTAVRATWLMAGFFVGRGDAIGNKDETSVAATKLGLLERPLGEDWLRRVMVSGNGAPIRGAEYTLSQALREDYDALKNHPQFNI